MYKRQSNSNAEEAEKLLVVTKDNIAQFKPVVHLHKVYYDEEKTSFRGHRISWDSVEGADYVIVFSGRPGDYTTGKIVEPDSDSGIIPVSYTHLDVYKRQGYGC